MILTPGALDGVWVIDSERQEDGRGSFTRLFCADTFARHGLPAAFPHCNLSTNARRGTLRGRIVPAVFLELTYHLEHHLYPQVPSHHLAELGRRLDPFLAANGVRPRRVP